MLENQFLLTRTRARHRFLWVLKRSLGFPAFGKQQRIALTAKSSRRYQRGPLKARFCSQEKSIRLLTHGTRQVLLRAKLLQTKYKTNKHQRPSITRDVLGKVQTVGLAVIVQKHTDNKGKWNPRLILRSKWLVWLSHSLGKQFLF